jgi:hypothetical protein
MTVMKNPAEKPIGKKKNSNILGRAVDKTSGFDWSDTVQCNMVASPLFFYMNQENLTIWD